MNDETIQTEESTVPEAETTLPDETVPGESTDEAVTEGTIYEDLSGTATEETIAMTTDPVLTVEVIESVGSDIIHADLFGSFLVCGTLIGLFLLRGIHGT